MSHRVFEELLAIQFFGEFLIDRWVITRQQLLDALDFQIQRNLKFGAIAVKKQFLTEEQVEQIRLRQRSSDMGFGELAVHMGCLRSEQAHEIAQYQKNNNIYLGEALLRLGHVTEDVLRRELAYFKEHQERHAPVSPVIPEGAMASDVLWAGVDTTIKVFRRVVSMTIKVGHGVLLTTDEPATTSGYFAISRSTLQGDVVVDYVLSVDRAIGVVIASGILHEDAGNEPDEIIVDAIKELCNIVCGNAMARLARNGRQMELMPPARLEAQPDPGDFAQTVAFPIRAIEGGMDLRFYVRGSGA